MALVDEFQKHLATLHLDGSSALVAVSGGPDSVALLDLLVRSRDRYPLALTVAHADHGIHPDSHLVADRVRTLAARYHLPFELGQLRLGPGAGETVARMQRYAWLEDTRARLGAELILLAHHADDQIETVLMRALRGSGPAGLAGMAARRGALVRPLLPFRRSALAEHVAAAGLPAWSDPANTDARHLRSWLRTELLPMLRARLPDVESNLQRLAAQAAADRKAWDLALDALPGLAPRVEVDGLSLVLAALAPLRPPLRAALLQAAARRVGCSLGPTRLARVEALLAGSASASGAAAPLGGRWRAALSFDRLFFVAGVAHGTDETGPSAGYGPDSEPLPLEGDTGEYRLGPWRISWRPEAAPARQDRGGHSAWLTPGPLAVRGWRAGEVIRPLAGRGRRPVTHCFQEARVPRWRRRGWPVLLTAPTETSGGEVVWVPGICRSDLLVPPPGAPALRFDVEHI